MFEDMTFEKIQKKTLSHIPDDMDKREGSVIWDATAGVSLALEEAYFRLDNFKDLVFPDTAAGEFLDRIAAAYDIDRKPAAPAVKKGKFNRRVPQGAGFLTVGEESLVYTADRFLGEEQDGYGFLLTCKSPGQAGNHYTGRLIPVEYLEGLETAELGELVTPGTDRETDEALRERLLNKIRRPSTSGNVHDYYNWAMECPGVGAVKIFPLAAGPGTVRVVIADEHKQAAGDALCGAVRDYIEERRPVGAAVSVVSAVEKAVNIHAEVRLSLGTNLGAVQAAYEKSVAAWLRDNAFDAAYLSLARMGNLLMEIEGVEDYSGLQLNGLSENMEIAPEEVAAPGAVRLEVITDGDQ